MIRMEKGEMIKPETLFLFFAIFFGLIFSFIQPLFIEPDSSYHFDNAMYISNTVVDRSSVGFSGEDFQSEPVPFTKVTDMMANGTYFKTFFEKKLPRIPKQQADHRISQWYGTENDITWYKSIMHLFPALGVKIGHAIYPSIGSMVIMARLVSLVFFVLSMFFIIKYVKAYKFIFLAISITPTIIQHATSLSYDCYNYIACAFMFMMAINLAVDIKNEKKLNLQYVLLSMLFPSIVLYFSKTNSKLMYLIIPAILLYLLCIKLKIKITKQQATIAICILVIIGFALFYMKYTNQSLMIIKKLVYSLMEPYYTVLSTEVISGTSTAAIPYWFYGIQVAVLTLVFLSYDEEVVPRWFTFGSLTLVLLNFLAVMISYAADPDFVDYAGRIITGPQGRYFTPFLILLAPVLTLLARKVTVKSGPWLIRLLLVMSAFALLLNLGITSVKFYHLQLPADEWRSGIHHYIFK